MRRFSFTTKDGRPGVVRPARPSDAAACLAVVWEATQERPRTLMTTPEEFWSTRQWRKHRLDWSENGVWLVAEVEGKVIASLGCDRARRPREKHLCEFGITVARAFRGVGVGRAVLETLEVWAREVGVEKIMLRVFDTNVRARALYEKMGYVSEGVERSAVKFPDEYIDAIRMAKFIAASPAAGSGQAGGKRGAGADR
jgi:L-phenylalanine/L-methionine N-acetyltransferase